jgi:glycosyltransferase involved in cell wall biosynthesis
MSHRNEKMLALGNTASVMPTIARAIKNLYVAYPTNISSVVLQENEKCFPADKLNHPLSVSCYKFVRKMSQTYRFFHAELGYAVACNAAGVPFGIHIHGVTDIALLFPKSPLGRFFKRPYKRALMSASYVACHPAVVEAIRSLRNDAVRLPLPIDTEQFNTDVKPFFFGEGVSIFSPIRMDRWKGHEIIWQALRLMKNRQKVTVYQSDWGWEPEYSFFKKNAPENVKFIPPVPREAIASRFKGATLVMGQMKIGHFGMTEMEAGACGAPVLVYLLDEHTPFLPKSNDSQSLAEAVDLLVEDEGLRARYSQSCSEYVLRSSNIDAISGELLAVMAASDMGPRTPDGGLIQLYLGTCFELVGRLLGDRMFGLLKAALIGL